MLFINRLGAAFLLYFSIMFVNVVLAHMLGYPEKDVLLGGTACIITLMIRILISRVHRQVV